MYLQQQIFTIYGGLINNVRRHEGPQKALNFGDHNSGNLIIGHGLAQLGRLARSCPLLSSFFVLYNILKLSTAYNILSLFKFPSIVKA